MSCAQSLRGAVIDAMTPSPRCSFTGESRSVSTARLSPPGRGACRSACSAPSCQRNGDRGARRRPSVGWSYSWKNPVATRCGSCNSSPTEFTRAQGMSAARNDSSHRRSARRRHLGNDRVQRIHALAAQDRVLHLWGMRELGASNDLEERRPVRAVVRQDRHEAVLRAVRLAIGCGQPVVARRPERGYERFAAQLFRHQERDRAFEHGRLDAAALTRASAVREARCHRDCKVQATDLVAEDRREVPRFALGIRVQGGDARSGLDDVVVRGLVGVRAALVVARCEGVDEVGLDACELFVGRDPALGGFRPHVVHDGVGAATSRASTVRDSGRFRSIASERLLRLKPMKLAPIERERPGRTVRKRSPCSGSILMTSAPRSPSVCVA